MIVRQKYDSGPGNNMLLENSGISASDILCVSNNKVSVSVEKLYNPQLNTSTCNHLLTQHLQFLLVKY